jgi:hypothetical protein
MDAKQQEYVEHEIQLRVLRDTMRAEFDLSRKNSDDKFAASRIEFDLMVKNIDDKLDNRFKSLWSIGILIMGMLMPVFLKSIGVL